MKRLSVFLIALVLSFGLVSSSYAAEGSHMEDSHMEGSYDAAAIDGHCPVCIIKGKIVQGKSNFATEYEGKLYYFVGFDQQKMFINDPETYIANLEKKYSDLKAKGEGSHMAEGSHMQEGSH